MPSTAKDLDDNYGATLLVYLHLESLSYLQIEDRELADHLSFNLIEDRLGKEQRYGVCEVRKNKSQS